ncbi:glycosyltransferase [Candidatus Woesearchaeota archaeon]|nr:glycosyltransferase [Candidatus Woesearchaeota archaeon]
MGDEEASWILCMGTFPPRECGIATFTKDLTTAIDKQFSNSVKTKILAMNHNSTNAYNYPKNVIFQINDADIQEYIDTAKRINRIDRIKLVCIQHEFGIFGGEYGSYLIAFLEMINKPVVITFHSVLPNPNERLKKVVQTLAEKSECIVVMANAGENILREEYGIKTDIEVIPHGIPTVEFIPSIREKKRKGYKENILLSSFGMISSGKGYETVIEALPNVVKKFPNLLYLIIGETHPIVRKNEGESYRNLIEEKVKQLGLEKNVKFYNKYITLKEITEYLQATDVFICSNVNAEQITSGTLAYAVGAGRAVVSTPFLHAKELIKPERGILADFGNPQSFEEAIIRILSDPKLKKSMEENAYANTRNMTWDNVALAYRSSFDRYADLSEKYELKIPKVKLSHLIKLTDDFGMIQFANINHPDISSGYTLDDNAKAMIVCCMHCHLFKDDSKLRLVKRYLNFIKYVQQDDGRLFNWVDYDRNINLENWSKDAHGRALWSLGLLSSTKEVPHELREKANKIFMKGLKVIDQIKSPRAVAFIIMGLYFHERSEQSIKHTDEIIKLSDYLTQLYKNCASEGWEWFEKYMTYSNSKLPEALFYSYLATKDRRYLNIAQSSLDFLISVTFEDGIFTPIGQNGWYFKNGKKAHFDQQPIEAGSMVQALLLANDVTKKEKYREYAVKAFQWFLGENSLNHVVYDESTGGCHDGVGRFSINLNQGAESTLAYLIATLSLSESLEEE